MRLLATVALAALASGCASQEQDAAATVATGTADGCAAVDATAFGATEGSGKWVAAADDLPAFCEVTATLSPVEGSKIGVVYRLPENWNGKVLGLGGGGWAGNVTIQAASEGLKKGYATFQTDGGNAGTDVWNNGWVAENPEAATDFSHRAIHEMTVAGKTLAASFYGTKHQRAYFQGCSTGGRMALMEAQRYPEDYDGIIAGAPVYTLQTQTSAVLRNMAFAQGGGGLSPDDLKLAQNAALKACDAADGLEDGLINDPAQCTWDPAELQCTGAKDATCLSAPQAAALKSVYEGSKTPDGQWAMLPMSRGGETGWSLFVGTDGKGNDPSGGGGLKNLSPLFFGNRTVDFGKFTMANVQQVRSSAFANMYEAKNPDLSAFFGRGGKLLLWHGENDPGPSPIATTDYAKAVLGSAAGAADSLRYFLAPGVEHCRGGPGADQVEWLDALDGWISSGNAPAQLTGTKADGSLTRPHCAWPNVAQYKGSGDANDPASWQCAARKES
ncbi:MAG TPA: tannase/feruloyl esterase family alpha/beta hydrolase [Croceibacterium sp.]|nr:tannase/feruloyl esterase family alpha/beta hydrolase [Croceibacterium sp.]